ncbi:MAG: SpvB/TcaC N-terminal domain-containing protein, partial [Saprospiraceae bacterium]
MYSIPIVLPLGTNDVEPSLSVSYSSGAGNGLLGMGWNISGLSFITRATKNIYFDNENGPVTLSNTDVFALDGQRLMRTGGSGYGVDGCIYGPESENFSIITSYGNTGGGPTWFKVESKDGVVMEYGNTSDSKFMNEAGTIVLFWRLNRIIYKDGNYVDYKYTNVDRDSRIDEILYTGNITTGLVPYNKVKFTYSVRSDLNTTYEAGQSVVSKHLIDKITVTTVGGVQSKAYFFYYGFNNISSYLKEVKEQGATGGELNTTIFKYGDEPPGFTPTTNTIGQNQVLDYFSADLDGNSYSDFIGLHRTVINNIVYHTAFTPHINNGNPSNPVFNAWSTVNLGTTDFIAFQPYAGSNHTYNAVDLNGDQFQDIVFSRTTGSGSTRRCTGIRTYATNPYTNSFSQSDFDASYYASSPGNTYVGAKGHYIQIGDFNGDGRSDLLTYIGLSEGPTFPSLRLGGSGNWKVINSSSSTSWPTQYWHQCDKIIVLDFNGDGKDDLMQIKDNTCNIISINEQGNIQVLYVSGFPTKWHLLYFGDFNGDRKVDLLTRTDPSNNYAPWKMAMSTGTGFIESNWSFNTIPDVNQAYHLNQIMINDYNGDGKSDIAHARNTGSTSIIDLYYSKGITAGGSTSTNFNFQQHSFSKPIITDPINILHFDSDGDGRVDILNNTGYYNVKDLLYFRKEGKEHLLQKIKNGYDHDTEFQYKRMNENNYFYVYGSQTPFPLNNIQAPMYLVSKYNIENGLGGWSSVEFTYEEAKLHKTGKGLLGFKKIHSKNLATGFTTTSELEFYNTFYVSAPLKETTFLSSNLSVISETTITNEFVNLGAKRFWARVIASFENKVFEGRTMSSNITYDIYGNTLKSVVNNNNIETKTTDFIQFEAWGSALPSKPRYITEKISRTGQVDYSHTKKFDYNTLGQLTGKTEFNGLAKSVGYTYTYNAMGNQTGITVSPSGLSSRSESKTYDTCGRFALTSTNVLGQVSSATYDDKWGKPLSQTSIIGIQNVFNYDQFGRLTSVYDPQRGITVSEIYGWEVNAAEGIVHYHKTLNPGRPTVIVYFDLLDRQKKRQEESLYNTWTNEIITYDNRGNVSSKTQPYLSGESILTTTNLYDTYNRLVSSTNLFGPTNIYYTYSGGNLTTTTINPTSQTSTKVTDATGKLISSANHLGSTLTYTYYSHGNIREVKNGSITLTSSEYDEYARQTKLIDINAGTTLYTTDALGQITWMNTATAGVMGYSYDLMGRKTLYSRPEGNTWYFYYPSGSGGATNMLQKSMSYSSSVIAEYTYDSYGRVSTKKETVDGIAHITTFTYNIYDDITSVEYPSLFKLNYYYDGVGNITSIKNGNNATTLFAFGTKNGLGQYKTYTLGDGKTTTKTYHYGIPTNYSAPGVQNLTFNWHYGSGNLTSRNDILKSKTESFTYDNLNRLLSCSGSGLSTISNTYLLNGNIDTKTDAGAYTYSSGTQINAVTKVTNSQNVIPSQTQNIAYTSYYQPSVITQNNFELTYSYAGDDERIKSVLKQNGTIINTRYYFGDYEKDITSGTTRHLHYVSNGSSVIAIVERVGSTDTYHYTYTDYLGSILTVTSSAGVIEHEQNFDAWGRSRNATSWAYTSIPTPPVWLYRGYTGHEHIPQMGIINMNGRLYDPVLGRMLSPDNHVQMPDYTQNYNRYSYALNNPLRYTDPDGEILVPILIGAAIGLLTNGVENLVNHRPFFAGGFKAAVMGGISGA